MLSNVALNRKRTISYNRIRHSILNEPVHYKIRKTQAPEANDIGCEENQADDAEYNRPLMRYCQHIIVLNGDSEDELREISNYERR